MQVNIRPHKDRDKRVCVHGSPSFSSLLQQQLEPSAHGAHSGGGSGYSVPDTGSWRSPSLGRTKPVMTGL